MSFVSSNWAAVVQQQQRLDDSDTSRTHAAAAQHNKKRRLSHPNSSTSTAINTAAPASSFLSSTSSSPVSSTSLAHRTPHQRVKTLTAHLQPTSHTSDLRRPSPSHSLSSSLSPSPSPSSTPSSSPPSPTLILALDCEMVGVGPGGARHALARCSLVNSLGQVLVDRYVQPLEEVTDYRTAVSGIRPHHLLPSTAATFHAVQAEVAALLSNRILVGHGLHGDLSVLLLSHPRAMMRDTAKWKGLCPGRPRGLKALAKEHLGVSIQEGEHDSVIDARTALALYLHHRKQWELDVAQRKRKAAVPGGHPHLRPPQRPAKHSQPSGEQLRPESAHTRQLHGHPNPPPARAGMHTYTSEGRVEDYHGDSARGERRGGEVEHEEEFKREQGYGDSSRRAGAAAGAAPRAARLSYLASRLASRSRSISAGWSVVDPHEL